MSEKTPFFYKIKQKLLKKSPQNKTLSVKILAGLVLMVVLLISSYPLIPAPQVQGYAKEQGVRQISYNAPIKVVFTQLMD